MDEEEIGKRTHQVSLLVRVSCFAVVSKERTARRAVQRVNLLLTIQKKVLAVTSDQV